MNRNSKHGFTLIEILISISIMTVLSTLSLFTFINIREKSRDSTRKLDLGQIQVALGSYYDNATIPSYPTDIPQECAGAGGIVSGGNTYLATVPHDPRCTSYTYYYYPFSNNQSACQTYQGQSAPCNCNGTTVLCDDYTLGAGLERETAASCAGAAGGNLCGSVDCNYCVGPFGKK